MAHQHLKSACCRAQIIRYGGKRRQCVHCQSTWTIRPKKKGRKSIRASKGLVERYFSGSISTIRTLERRFKWERSCAQRIMKRSLAAYIAKHCSKWQSLLTGDSPLVAVADAIWHSVIREKLTIYLILLRPADGNEATILPPILVSGHEDREGWEYAWERIPEAYKRRICGLVCDGQRWLIAFGQRRGWVVQRCHFHLLANLQMYMGVSDLRRNQEVLSLVNNLLSTANQDKSCDILDRLAKIRANSKSRGMRRVLAGLETNYHDFQNYLCHPEMNLPTTTNAAESCISGIREFMRRCRGFRSKKMVESWITGYLLWKKTIRCNGKNQQKK